MDEEEYYIAGQYVSKERREKMERLNAALLEVSQVLSAHNITLPEVYQEYVYRLRRSRVIPVYRRQSTIEDESGEEGS